MKVTQVSLARGASLAYKGYLIIRNSFTDDYLVTKDGYLICSPQTLAAAKADVDLLTEGE